MQLEKLQLELFPDYSELQKHLDNMDDRHKGKRPRHNTSPNALRAAKAQI